MSCWNYWFTLELTLGVAEWLGVQGRADLLRPNKRHNNPKSPLKSRNLLQQARPSHKSPAMTSTEYIKRPDGKRVAITISSGENFMSLTDLHFQFDPVEAPYHAPPRDIHPPGYMQNLEDVPKGGQLSHDKNVLCERCSKIDLRTPPPLSSEKDWGNTAKNRKESIEETKARGGFQIEGYVCDLGHFPEDFNLSSCRLCQTLASIRTRLLKSPLGNPPWPYELHVVSAAYVHFAEQKSGAANMPEILAARGITDTTVFAVDPKPPHIFFYGRVGFWLTEHSGTSGHLYPTSSNRISEERKFVGRKLEPDCIDYSILRSWISSCKTYHSTTCARESSSSSTDIPYFKVIDCTTRRVVPAGKEVPYVALSYVWGQQHGSEEDKVNSEALPDTVAQVIEDAIIVTKELGFQYLWVDKYCIVQEDNLMKQMQLENMDAVYEGAEVCIIAAAGEDASFGLPGVSRRHRIPQPSVQIENEMFVSSGPHLKDLMQLSKWASRGWTYQEGLLSRRRLLFTEYQTYFECQYSHCCEAIDAPQDVLFENRSIRKAHSVSSHDSRVFPSGQPVSKTHQILQRIQEYASKNLTYKSDALNGIMGVLSVMEKQKSSTTHLWGIPILTLTQTSELLGLLSNNSHVLPERKVELITRDANEALLFGLRWEASPGKRNPEFPSWSWTGWAGPLSLRFPPADVNWAITEVSPLVRFWVEDLNGNLIDWTDFHASKDQTQGRLPPVSPFLHIEGLAVKLNFEFGKIKGSNEAFPHRRDKFGPYVRFTFNELQISICPLRVIKWEDDMKAYVDRLVNGTWEALILSHRGSPLPDETLKLGQEVDISYKTLAEEKQTDFELLVLEPVGSAYERLGTVKLVFPGSLEVESPGHLTIERKRFRLG